MSLFTRTGEDAAPRVRRRSSTTAERGHALVERRVGVAPRQRAAGGDDRRVPPDVLLVCSSGGHLAQLVTLSSELVESRRRWVCFDTEDALSLLADEALIPAHHPTTRNVRNLLRNTRLAWDVLRDRRPDVVISSGAAVAVPFFVLARALGVPTVYVEVFDRLDGPTLTGRLCRPFTTRMLVQWEEQLAFYPRATVVGPLL
ncbi:hypothetical protein WDZ16_06305 [Pseudokineococcus marinus]|uniref:UDP-N-acetylglucosamine--LPS N-acetylglucosamine transferase n=1 Tax=Pseudokineococcus marinus TaxID=351215 RepID=A0A849BF50_9ACTN|nr:UDP-N-acetylglucosamine--LPS N-acetylglucosamine transferase [Pseudokineococcus marinus]NNH21689.1 UDP-N-acetylglucosamine--LPS N-acetylglucosamine transferase [Pseudokineococcus marinus]